MNTPRIAILGATGRMGRAIIQAAATAGIPLGAAIEKSGSPEMGRDAAAVAGLPEAKVIVSDDLAKAAASFDVLIDFTRPEATLAALAVCVTQNKGIVIGTTGFTPEQRVQIEAASKKVPVCLSGNYSIGINLLQKLVTEAARTLGYGFDIEIVEAHHRHKVDAPSGTALMLGEAAAKGAGRDLKTCAVYERYGHTGARDAKTIGFSTVRGGDVVGDHTVMFLGEGERVEITHKASSRLNFANGAVRAAAWLAGKPAGLYSMQDVLKL